MEILGERTCVPKVESGGLPPTHTTERANYDIRRFQSQGPAVYRALLVSTPRRSLSASGITYSAHLHKGNKVEITEIKLEDGSPPDPEKTYTVAVSSFAAAADFSHKDPGHALNMPGRDCLIQYLRKHGKVDYAKVRRAHITRDPGMPLD